MHNYYDLLGCKQDASVEEIRRKYKELILKCHPDKSCENIASENPHDDFIVINTAWKTLSDPTSRKRYDASLFYENIETERVLYDQVCLNELLKDTKGVYYYVCRCGGYIYYSKDVDGGDGDGEDSILLECDQCSHTINVIFGNK